MGNLLGRGEVIVLPNLGCEQEGKVAVGNGILELEADIAFKLMS